MHSYPITILAWNHFVDDKWKLVSNRNWFYRIEMNFNIGEALESCVNYCGGEEII